MPNNVNNIPGLQNSNVATKTTVPHFLNKKEKKDAASLHPPPRKPPSIKLNIVIIHTKNLTFIYIPNICDL